MSHTWLARSVAALAAAASGDSHPRRGGRAAHGSPWAHETAPNHGPKPGSLLGGAAVRGCEEDGGHIGANLPPRALCRGAVYLWASFPDCTLVSLEAAGRFATAGRCETDRQKRRQPRLVG